MPGNCLQFCSLTHEQAEGFTIDATHIPCVFNIFDIIECMQSGQGKIFMVPTWTGKSRKYECIFKSGKVRECSREYWKNTGKSG